MKYQKSRARSKRLPVRPVVTWQQREAPNRLLRARLFASMMAILCPGGNVLADSPPRSRLRCRNSAFIPWRYTCRTVARRSDSWSAERQAMDFSATLRLTSSTCRKIQASPRSIRTASSPLRQGTTAVRITGFGKKTRVPVTVEAVEQAAPVSFTNEVMAIFGKAGCNTGACHGNASGKGGFKLSLRGYNPAVDLETITRDELGRRLNTVAIEASLSAKARRPGRARRRPALRRQLRIVPAAAPVAARAPGGQSSAPGKDRSLPQRGSCPAGADPAARRPGPLREWNGPGRDGSGHLRIDQSGNR